MRNEQNAVKEFHLAFGHPVADTPTLLTPERAKARYKWMKEEIDEFLEASQDGDLVEQADAMVDVIYFALGTLVEMGVDGQALFDVVQRANMSKLWEDGKAHYNADGKVIKPSIWQDPHDIISQAIEDMKNTGLEA